jgi:hypothetical protein
VDVLFTGNAKKSITFFSKTHSLGIIVVNKIVLLRQLLCICFLLILSGVVVVEMRGSERLRSTFVFYDRDTNRATVEERLLYREPDTERAIYSYVEEMLYGPMTPSLMPLFLPETSVLSLLYRNGAVFVNLSESAAFPIEGIDLTTTLSIMEQGIRRNFPVVQTVHIFIKGYGV